MPEGSSAAKMQLVQALGIRIFNKADKNVKIPPGAVYVGRPTRFGNPFTHLKTSGTLAQTKVATREQAVDAYEIWAREKIRVDPEFKEAVKSLYHKDLVCWCWPKDCHAVILAILAKELHDVDFLEHMDIYT